VIRPCGIDIVRRAYELWKQAGMPDGKDQEFYYQAERELIDAAVSTDQPDREATTTDAVTA
jgi:hypothetical protein